MIWRWDTAIYDVPWPPSDVTLIETHEHKHAM